MAKTPVLLGKLVLLRQFQLAGGGGWHSGICLTSLLFRPSANSVAWQNALHRRLPPGIRVPARRSWCIFPLVCRRGTWRPARRRELSTRGHGRDALAPGFLPTC